MEAIENIKRPTKVEQKTAIKSYAALVAALSHIKEVETENKDIQNTISADIIELATNAPEDFSIATLASQAKRISEEKNNLGEDEVIISLR